MSAINAKRTTAMVVKGFTFRLLFWAKGEFDIFLAETGVTACSDVNVHEQGESFGKNEFL